jgi:hypothetical protein
MTIVQEVKKIIPSKLDDKAKVVYNRLKEETNNFDVEFLVVYADLEKAVEEFVEIVKKKYPDAIKIVRKKEKPTPPPPTPEPETDDKEVIEVMKDYRISETQAKKLVQLRRDASESKKESIDKMLDTLKTSEFYNARYTSKQNIDKNRTRDIGKDSNRGSLTSKDEMNMTGRKFKRISKAGHKNQYGTTEGGKVYYEYRANRRDIDDKIRLENGGMASQGRFKKRFSNGGKIEKGDNVNVIAENKSGVVMNVISNGKHFTIQFVDGTKKVYDKNEIRKIFDEYDEFSEGGGVENFKYERGQKFEDQYGEIILLNKYSDTLWEARRWSGMRHVGDVVISEKDLDLIRTKKMAQGDLVHGRFSKHFKKGGATEKATYIPKSNIKALTTTYGNTIKGKDLLDGAYTTRKDIRKDPKMIRSIFEEEYFEEFGEGGGIQMGLIYRVDGKDYLFTSQKQNYQGNYDLWEAYEIVYDNYEGEKHVNYEKTKTSSRLKYFPSNVKVKNVSVEYFKKGGGINNYAKGGWVLYDEDTQKLIKKYKTEAEAKADLYEYYGNANIVKESVWNKTTEPKVDRFMFEEEMYEFKKGGKTPKDFENLIYGVKVIETIGNKTNEVIVAMFQEKFERDAFLLKREERKARRISASSKEIPNYDYQIIPINPY